MRKVSVMSGSDDDDKGGAACKARLGEVRSGPLLPAGDVAAAGWLRVLADQESVRATQPTEALEPRAPHLPSGSRG